MIGETKFFGVESVSGLGELGRPKSFIRRKMDEIEVGEGFDVIDDKDILKKKRKAQTIANNLNPHGKRFSIRWIEAGKTFRVIRTK
jgi:hypothetical protein